VEPSKRSAEEARMAPLKDGRSVVMAGAPHHQPIPVRIGPDLPDRQPAFQFGEKLLGPVTIRLEIQSLCSSGG
jgi:hypothetical protein